MVMKEEMLMEEKLVINELEQRKELANRLMNNFKNPSSSSSKDSNKILISELLLSYENAIAMLSLDKKTLKRSPERIDQSSKKRRLLEKKSEKGKIRVGTGQEETSLDDGYCWRKYGHKKNIHGYNNPRGYYRCTHRITRGCLAVKQVQKSDKDTLCYEIKYLESHTCHSSTSSTTKYSVAVLQEERNKGPKLVVTEESEDIVVKHMMKSEELMLSLDDLDNKKEIFRTFSFSNPEAENVFDWKNLIEDMLNVFVFSSFASSNCWKWCSYSRNCYWQFVLMSASHFFPLGSPWTFFMR